MKTTPNAWVVAALSSALWLAACNDTNVPPAPPAPTPPVVQPPPPPAAVSAISRFVASLLAMVSGAACDTALPASLDSDTQVLIEDMDVQDANALAENCAS